MDLRCIVVDDNRQYLETAVRILRSDGIDVVGIAGDAATALALVEELRPDVVLVDVELGDDSGLDLAHQLQTLRATPATILISTHAEEDLGCAVAESRAIGFIGKTRLSGACVRELLAQWNRGT
jgi:DNA-binding NarL/FixJ family response regulator